MRFPKLNLGTGDAPLASYQWGMKDGVGAERERERGRE